MYVGMFLTPDHTSDTEAHVGGLYDVLEAKCNCISLSTVY